MLLHAKVKNSIFSIILWFKNVKQKYLEKSPFEKWCLIRDIHMFLNKIIGCDFNADGYKVTLRTWLPSIVIIEFIILLLYTMYFHRNDPIRALFGTPVIALILPCVVNYMIILVTSSRKAVTPIYNFAGECVYANSNSTPKNNYICDQMAINLMTRSIKTCLFIMFSLNFSACIPLYNLFFNSESTYDERFIIPIIVPFVDPYTERGFYINLTNQIIICAIGIIAIPSCELCTCILTNCISVTAAVIANALTEFGEMIQTKKRNSTECILKFRNIVIQCMDFDRCISGKTDVFFWKFLLQPISLMYAIIFCIYLYILGFFGANVGCIACCYIQLLILCDVGKAADDAGESIVDALNQFPFYMLPTDKQKMFSLLLKRNQNEGKIKIGPFAKLNYETATNLTKSMYTFCMCLFNTRS